MKKVLTIAGSDSSAGAGIQQDLKVFSHLGAYGTTAVTAVTAQNTLDVQKVFVLPLDVISSQIDSVMRDIAPRAVKTGMLYDSEVIRLVHKKLRKYRAENLVVDPVMVSTSGRRLLDEEAIEDLRKLMSYARLSTPNIPEAEVLSGIEIRNHRDMENAAETIGDCVIKGGHLDAVDILFFRGKFHYFSGGERVDAKIHGAGCAFSAALAVYLARGKNVVDAVGKTKDYVDESIGRNFSIGSGLRIVDTAGLKLGKTYPDRERSYVISNIEKAIRLFVSDANSYRLIPQVGTNIAMALSKADSLEDVAGVTGRLVRDRCRVVPVGQVDYGGSSHVGRVVLTAMRHDKTKKAAMNIRFDQEIVEACGKLGLSIGGFDREKQPKDMKTMEMGSSEAIKAFGAVPDIIYDRGSRGREAMVRIIGKDALGVAKTAVRIGRTLQV